MNTTPTLSGSSIARQFQLLLCQSLLGLPLERLLDNHPHFGQWLSQIQNTHPEIWELPESQKATNYQLELDKAGQYLSTTIDLLLATPDSASIFGGIPENKS